MKRLILSILVAAVLAGCPRKPPTPFETSAEAPPPAGCSEARQRGGDC